MESHLKQIHLQMGTLHPVPIYLSHELGKSYFTLVLLRQESTSNKYNVLPGKVVHTCSLYHLGG